MSETTKLADERYSIRRSNPTDPNIITITQRFRSKVDKHIRDRWKGYMEKTVTPHPKISSVAHYDASTNEVSQ